MVHSITEYHHEDLLLDRSLFIQKQKQGKWSLLHVSQIWIENKSQMKRFDHRLIHFTNRAKL